jgi:hypothetical protein
MVGMSVGQEDLSDRAALSHRGNDALLMLSGVRSGINHDNLG